MVFLAGIHNITEWFITLYLKLQHGLAQAGDHEDVLHGRGHVAGGPQVGQAHVAAPLEDFWYFHFGYLGEFF